MLQENTVDGWTAVAADLAAKANRYQTEAAELVQARDALALDAELGQDGAARRLQKILGEIASKEAAAQSLRTAIAQAQAHLATARKTEAEAAERQRQEKLSALAARAMRHAAEFTDALRKTIEAGNEAKAVVRAMLALATPGEQPNVDQLLRTGPYMRAAEHAGLKAFVEFQGYPGLREHVVALEGSFKVHLGRWLKGNENGKEQN
jgi:hypothetical protein